MKHPATAVLSARMAFLSKLYGAQKERAVTSYFKAVNDLLEMYPTDDIIAGTDAHMMHSTQTLNKSQWNM